MHLLWANSRLGTVGVLLCLDHAPSSGSLTSLLSPSQVRDAEMQTTEDFAHGPPEQRQTAHLSPLCLIPSPTTFTSMQGTSLGKGPDGTSLGRQGRCQQRGNAESWHLSSADLICPNTFRKNNTLSLIDIQVHGGLRFKINTFPTRGSPWVLGKWGEKGFSSWSLFKISPPVLQKCP